VPETLLGYNDFTKKLSLASGNRRDAQALADWAVIKVYIKEHQPVLSINQVIHAFNNKQNEHEPLGRARVDKAIKWAQRHYECTGSPGQGKSTELSVIEAPTPWFKGD
jgi:hypothetical protein